MTQYKTNNNNIQFDSKMGNQSIQEIKIINAEDDEHIIANKYKT